MALARQLATQLARPEGSAGRLLGRAMDLANRRPTRLALDLLDPQPGERILDAGCGTGAAMAAILRHAPCRVTGIDPSAAMLASATRRLAPPRYGGRSELHRAGLESMPFADGSFDAAIALNVLYFCDAEGRMLADVHRVLRPGGRLVAYVTHRETMERWPFAREGLHRLFDAGELARMLANAGFAAARIAVHDVAVTRSVRGLLACALR